MDIQNVSHLMSAHTLSHHMDYSITKIRLVFGGSAYIIITISTNHWEIIIGFSCSLCGGFRFMIAGHCFYIPTYKDNILKKILKEKPNFF